MTQVDDKSSIIINNVKYEISLLSTSRAFITGQQLLKLGLPSLGAAADGMTFTDEFADSQTWQAVAIHMTNQFENVDLLDIVKELVEGLTADGLAVDFETGFRKKLDLLTEIVEFAIKENYSSLFTGTSLIRKLATFIKEYQTQSSAMVETPEAESELTKSLSETQD